MAILDQVPELVDEQLAGRRRRHEHRHDHDDPDRLDADDDRDPDEAQQQVVEGRDRQTGRRRSGRIERGVQQLLAQDRDDQQDDAAEDGDLEDVRRT